MLRIRAVVKEYWREFVLVFSFPALFSATLLLVAQVYDHHTQQNNPFPSEMIELGNRLTAIHSMTLPTILLVIAAAFLIWLSTRSIIRMVKMDAAREIERRRREEEEGEPLK